MYYSINGLFKILTLVDRMFDLIIKNGLLYDGSGEKPKKLDIAITSDKISQIGNFNGTEADKIIDAQGLSVSPGFIDTHSHADFDILKNPQHLYGISQGVTTEILSPDGIGIVPLSKSKSQEHIKYLSGILGHPTEEFDGTSFDEAKKYYHKKSKCNVAVFAAHGPLRLELCGMEDIPLDGDLMKKAKYNLEEAFEQGAAGFSTGLDYYPQTFATTDELIELSKVAASKNKVYSVHLRSHEKDRAFANGGILEAIEVARKSGVSLVVEHYRTVESNAGEIDKLLEPVDKAKKEGIDITMETYSYPVGCTIPLIFFPGAFHLGGFDNVMSILRDKKQREYWEQELLKNSPRHDIEGAMWTSIGNDDLKHYAGLSVKDAAEMDNLSPIQHVMDIMLKTELNCGFRVIPPASISKWRKVEEDIMTLLQRPDYLVGSDSVPVGQVIHPRAYGCFTRILGRLRRRFNIPLELLINRMTKFPADKIGLQGRGQIKENNFADLVIFDADEINDLATFEDPEIVSVGIKQVFVNGKLSYQNKKDIKELNGYFI
ncbi:MAG: hypothetical protein CL745_02195 [Chloroflexi bacterium]|nr:hypothetical protein [Chloroflexota bacterium]|tara:strand:- start:2214 stop:3848 length:1635 start_codon:yes stop_codon:yes gene_type:complete